MNKWGSTDVKEELVKEKEKKKQTIALMEDQPTLPQAATLTPKSDVRTLDKPSDPEKTLMPTEKRHCRVWLIPITINQTSTLAFWIPVPPAR